MSIGTGGRTLGSRGGKTLKLNGLASLPLPEPKTADHGTVLVQPGDLFQFLFPSGFFHSKSTARLYIFVEYGPVLVKVREGWMSLRSGYKGQHILTEQELSDMIEDMIKEDVLKVCQPSCLNLKPPPSLHTGAECGEAIF